MIKMKRTAVLAALLLVALPLLLTACSGLKDVPLAEQKYVEGVVVEGGVYGVRIKDDNGKVWRFITKSGVAYQPEDFHAYYGDRLAINYYSEGDADQPRHLALSIRQLAVAQGRPDFDKGRVEGIMRAAGMMRYLVHIPEMNLTAAFKKGNVETSPVRWQPEAGDKVRLDFSQESSRFFKTFKSQYMERLSKESYPIENTVINGSVAEILSTRTVPDRFSFNLENGEQLTLHTGGATIRQPGDLTIEPGATYTVEYYSMLLGDQRLRHVVTKISR